MIAMPFGGLPGAGAVALVVAAACLIGEFWFYGLDFLPLVAAPPGALLIPNLVVVPALLGLAYHYVLWSLSDRWLSLRTAPPTAIGPPTVRWRVDLLQYALLTDPTAVFVLSIILLLQIGFSLIAPEQYWCLLMRAPNLIALANFIPPLAQFVLVCALRKNGMTRRAFGAMLILDAVVVANACQTLAVDHFRRGLERDPKVSPESPIASAENVGLFIDYRTATIVMRTTSPGAHPSFEHRRSLSALVICRR